MAREKFRFKVLVETEVEIDLDVSYWGNKEKIEEWSKYLYPIDGVENIAEYAARMAAIYPDSYHDSIGMLIPIWDKESAKESSIVFDILSEDEDVYLLD